MTKPRPIASPFVVAPPVGARVRTRLPVGEQDVLVLAAVGEHLAALANRDLAARCAEGKLTGKEKAASRKARKQAAAGGLVRSLACLRISGSAAG